jgi:hypothetical protein
MKSAYSTGIGLLKLDEWVEEQNLYLQIPVINVVAKRHLEALCFAKDQAGHISDH